MYVWCVCVCVCGMCGMLSIVWYVSVLCGVWVDCVMCVDCVDLNPTITKSNSIHHPPPTQNCHNHRHQHSPYYYPPSPHPTAPHRTASIDTSPPIPLSSSTIPPHSSSATPPPNHRHRHSPYYNPPSPQHSSPTSELPQSSTPRASLRQTVRWPWNGVWASRVVNYSNSAKGSSVPNPWGLKWKRNSKPKRTTSTSVFRWIGSFLICIM